MTKRQMIFSLALGFLVFLAFRHWSESILNEAHQMLCDEGSLRADLCTAQTSHKD